MEDLSKTFYNNACSSNYEYIELYQQSGYVSYLSGSSKYDIKETSIDVEGMCLRVLSNKKRKMISTPNTSKNMLQYLFNKISKYNNSINLSQEPSNKLIKNVSYNFLQEVFYSIDDIFKKYNIKYNFDIQKSNISRCIYNNSNQNIIFKKDTDIYIFIKYYIKDRQYTFFDVIFNKSYNKILYRLKEDILNYINLNSNKIISSGRYDVILAPDSASKLLHECCGHLFEASKTRSPFYSCTKNKILSNPKLTVIDDVFHIKNKELYDDEGNKKSKTYIIENGKFENLLTDKYTSIQSNLFRLTGNCRRQSYSNFPEPRMYCTYVKKGNDSIKDIFNSIDNGIFIKYLGEAYVNNISGNFQSMIEKGYIIKNGKIDHPIYGIKIEDNAKVFLKNIKYISNDLKILPSICNSNSGLLYVEYGSPTILVKNINFKY